jgi:N-acetylglucosaminylphosphatidylinositol deacetylase
MAAGHIPFITPSAFLPSPSVLTRFHDGHSKYASMHAQAPVTFTLTTTALPRKYTFLGDLPLTALPFLWRIVEALSFPTHTANPRDGARALVANTWHRYRMTRDAFAQHPSQYTWDRHLYMVLSRYVWFNDLKRIPRASADPAQQLAAF